MKKQTQTTARSFAEAKMMAGDYFRENFGYQPSQFSPKHYPQTEVKNEAGEVIGYFVEYYPIEDPAIEDTYKITVLFEK